MVPAGVGEGVGVGREVTAPFSEGSFPVNILSSLAALLVRPRNAEGKE